MGGKLCKQLQEMGAAVGKGCVPSPAMEAHVLRPIFIVDSLTCNTMRIIYFKNSGRGGGNPRVPPPLYCKVTWDHLVSIHEPLSQLLYILADHVVSLPILA